MKRLRLNNNQKHWQWTFLAGLVIIFLVSGFFRWVKLTGDWEMGWQANKVNAVLAMAQNRVRQSEAAIATMKANAARFIAKQLPHLKNPSALLGQIVHYFPEEPETALAVFKNESGFNTKARNWNCFFDADPWQGGKAVAEKTQWSWSCPKGQEALAWSVDCGVGQINLLGKQCPEYAFDLEWNLKQARRKYEARGFKPWTVYRDGRYKQSLEWAKDLLAKGSL